MKGIFNWALINSEKKNTIHNKSQKIPTIRIRHPSHSAALEEGEQQGPLRIQLFWLFCVFFHARL